MCFERCREGRGGEIARCREGGADVVVGMSWLKRGGEMRAMAGLTYVDMSYSMHNRCCKVSFVIEISLCTAN